MMCGTTENRAVGMEGNAVVCQNGGEKRFLDVFARLFGGCSGTVCLSFRDRFDILLEKRPSGLAG